VAYYSMMKGFADEMAAVGKRLDNEDVICYILAGLDIDFNHFVEAFTAKTEPQILQDMYSQLVIVEAHVESQKEHQHITVNATYHGGRGGRGPMRGHGNGGFHGGRGGGRNGDRGGNKIPYQVCGKPDMVLSGATSILMQVTMEKRSMCMLLPPDTMLTLSGTQILVLLIISRLSWTS
jgi:hypothetical protein